MKIKSTLHVFDIGEICVSKLCGSSAGFCLIRCSYVGVFKCNRPGYLGYEKPWKVSPKQHCLELC